MCVRVCENHFSGVFLPCLAIHQIPPDVASFMDYCRTTETMFSDCVVMSSPPPPNEIGMSNPFLSPVSQQLSTSKSLALFKLRFSLRKLIKRHSGKLTWVFNLLLDLDCTYSKWRFRCSPHLLRNLPPQRDGAQLQNVFIPRLQLFIYSLFTFDYGIASENEIKIIRQRFKTWAYVTCPEYQILSIGT